MHLRDVALVQINRPDLSDRVPSWGTVAPAWVTAGPGLGDEEQLGGRHVGGEASLLDTVEVESGGLGSPVDTVLMESGSGVPRQGNNGGVLLATRGSSLVSGPNTCWHAGRGPVDRAGEHLPVDLLVIVQVEEVALANTSLTRRPGNNTERSVTGVRPRVDLRTADHAIAVVGGDSEVQDTLPEVHVLGEELPGDGGSGDSVGRHSEVVLVQEIHSVLSRAFAREVDERAGRSTGSKRHGAVEGRARSEARDTLDAEVLEVTGLVDVRVEGACKCLGHREESESELREHGELVVGLSESPTQCSSSYL